MKYIFLLFVLSVFLPMIFGLFRNPRKKAGPILEYVQKRGYRLVNPAVAQVRDSSVLEIIKNPALRHLTDASSDLADIKGLDHGTGDWLAFTCNLRSKEVTIFNYSTTPRRADAADRSISYKVAKIKAAGLPRFSLGKNSIVHRIKDVVGKIVGAPEPTIAIDRNQHPEFAAQYWVRGTDASAVSAFLSPERINFIETAKLPGVLATNANYLVYFDIGILRGEEDLDSFVATAEKLIACFL